MGYLDDLSSLIKKAVNVSRTGIQSANELDSALSPFMHKSITKGAMDGTLQFPCLIPDSIPVDMATTIARMLERVYATFVQTYLSLNSTIDISVDKNPTQFLRKFHQNVHLESVTDEDEYREYIDRAYDGKAKIFINKTQDTAIVFDLEAKRSRAMYESHKAQLVEFMAGIDYTPIPNVGNSPFYVKEDISSDPYSITPEELLRAQLSGASNDRKEKYKSELQRRRTGMNTPIINDKDIKKSNDLQPYTMNVRLMAVNGEQEFVQFIDFVVGVKVNLHLVNSDEMATNIIAAISNNGLLHNIIKWTTGEKSLVRDLLLNIDNVKLDAANKSRGASPWWTTFKRMKTTARRQAALLQRNVIVPVGTIVLCSTDVDYITKKSGFNLRDPRMAIKLREALYLMNIIIVDTGTRTIEVLYDGTNSYQTFALESIEREITASSSKIGKELTRMISR